MRSFESDYSKKIVVKPTRRLGAFIGAALVSGISILGCSSESSATHACDTNKPKVTATAKAPKKPAVKPALSTTTTTESPTTTTTPALKRSELQSPLLPAGGQYDIAADAAFDVTDDEDVSDAEKLLAEITNPSIKAQAEHAVQVAIASDAAYDVSDSFEFQTAETLLGEITIPDVKAKAQAAVSAGFAAQAAFNITSPSVDQTSVAYLKSEIKDPNLIAKVNLIQSEQNAMDTTGAQNNWDTLYENASTDWDNLYTQANSEWNSLYLHTDGYLRYYEQTPVN